MIDSSKNKPTEKHPFPEYIPKGCKYLVLGSFPPIKLTTHMIDNMGMSQTKAYNNFKKNKRNQKNDKDIEFYYGSSDNLLWHEIIAPLLKVEFKTKDNITDMLNNYCIGVTDIVEQCTRKIKDDKIDSSDSSLDNIIPRPIISLIEANNFSFIFCTSQFVKESLLKMAGFQNLKNRPEIVVLLSPSKSASRSIGRLEEYKNTRGNYKERPTIEFRKTKYKTDFITIIKKD